MLPDEPTEYLLIRRSWVRVPPGSVRVSKEFEIGLLVPDPVLSVISDTGNGFPIAGRECRTMGTDRLTFSLESRRCAKLPPWVLRIYAGRWSNKSADQMDCAHR
jgi:hypothetical protein